jgi:hypothetical protein
LQWQPTAQTQGQAPVNPAVLAQQAVSKLGLTSPTIEMAPPDGAEQLVGRLEHHERDSLGWGGVGDRHGDAVQSGVELG